MAHHILGIDLGAYSVKVVVSNPGFRQAHVVEVVERRVPPGDEPHLIRAASVVAEILLSVQKEDDLVYSAISGEKVFFHTLDFGFKGMKRADLERVVGSELEGVLPVDLEDMVYAFEQIPKQATAGASGEEEDTAVRGSQEVVRHGLVADPTSGMRILAAAMQKAGAEEFLVAMQRAGADPRGLLASPSPYARLAEKLLPHHQGTVAIFDIGHMRSDFVVSKNGRPVFARSIARGGHQLTRHMAKVWNMDEQSAEAAKHANGCIASRRQPATSDASLQISNVLEKELLPLARELKRTMKACLAKTGYATDEIVLLGGGSRLPGIAAYLEEHTNVPVGLLHPESSSRLLGDVAATTSLDICGLALGVAMEGASAKPSFDLRQGALAVKADLSFLRTKVKFFATAAIAIMAFGIFSAYQGVRKLREAEAILQNRVAVESMAAFGQELEAAEVLTRVGNVKNGVIINPVPKMTAYDMLIAFNEALPPKDKAVLEVSDIAIEPGKVIVRASSSAFEETKALQGLKNLEESLKASKCFKNFPSPESKPGRNESRDFTLAITTECNK